MIAPSPKRLLPLLAIAALTGLAGCGNDVSRSFGLTRDAPDEFSVTTRAPLSMPPSDKLMPPRPGASRPQELQAGNAGAATLVPQSALSNAGASGKLTPGEVALLNASGQPAPADIRDQVDADSALTKTDRSFTDRLLFWRSKPVPGTVVDPQREAQRLRENAALGQPADIGDTPIIQPKPKGFFDTLF